MTEEEEKNLRKKLDAARFFMLRDDRLRVYAAASLYLEDVIGDFGNIDTAATDGTHIYWNPKFLSELTNEEVRFVILHEALHCLHLHFLRFEPSPRANAACDYVINLLLSKYDNISMPKVGLLDTQYEGLCEEEVYAKLKDDTDFVNIGGFLEPKKGDKDGSGQSISISIDALEERWKSVAIKAAMSQAGKERGNVPDDVKRLIERITAQKVSWKDETHDFIMKSVSFSNDWSRMARRHSLSPYIVPKRKVRKTGLIAFIRDTSGSVDDATVGAFNDLIGNCCSEMGSKALIIDCDAKVHKEYMIEPGDSVPSTAVGGGGTDFEPAFKYIENHSERENICGIVYLTDMYGSFPKKPPELPTLWISVSTIKEAPFGRVVNV